MNSQGRGPRASDLSEGELDALLVAEKDANNHECVWTPARAPDGTVFSAALVFGVSALGHLLLVRAEWKGPLEQQIFLMFPSDTNSRLARICLTRCHNGIPHWHFLEQVRKVKERNQEITDPPLGPTAIDGLVGIFVDKMNIRNLHLQGTLYGPGANS